MGEKRILWCECRRCGEEIKARNGEELRQRQTKHIRECHPGFSGVRTLEEKAKEK